MSLDELSDEDLAAHKAKIIGEINQLQRAMGQQLDPITFVSAQVHVLIKELWPDDRDQDLFDIKVHQEIKTRLEEFAVEARKQQLVSGIGMAPPAQTPRNRAEQRRMQRGR